MFIIIGSKQNIAKINELDLPSIKINNKAIKREKTVKNLGILFDENLSWDAEINKCISNGYYKLKQAFRYKHFLTKESKKIIVQSYILSQFNYSSIILQNLTKLQVEKIQKFQNTCVRYILNLKKFDHISHCYPDLNILKMVNSRNLQSLTLMHKICSGNAPQYLIDKIVLQGEHHNHQTRTRNNLNIARFHTNYGKNRFFNFIGNKYNCLKNQLNILPTTSVNVLKTKLKKYFQDA